jgi:polyphenol oxidase
VIVRPSPALLEPFLLAPDWRVPAAVCAAVTTRIGGVSAGAWGDADGRAIGLNLGAHVGDDPHRVDENRHRLEASLPGPVHWLQQVHGTAVHVVDAPPGSPGTSGFAGTSGTSGTSGTLGTVGTVGMPPPVADAAITSVPGQVLAVMTADCLPVLLADDRGRCVGVAHAGWRGLAAGVIEATVEAMRGRLEPPARLVAWLGPAIGPDAFEVGEDVLEAFCSREPGARAAFHPGPAEGKWFCDLYRLARMQLRRAGVDAVGGGDRCTFLEPETFYSHRRDGITGRFASLVWLRR